jgi:hypothetical protein
MSRLGPQLGRWCVWVKTDIDQGQIGPRRSPPKLRPRRPRGPRVGSGPARQHLRQPPGSSAGTRCAAMGAGRRRRSSWVGGSRRYDGGGDLQRMAASDDCAAADRCLDVTSLQPAASIGRHLLGADDVTPTTPYTYGCQTIPAQLVSQTVWCLSDCCV